MLLQAAETDTAKPSIMREPGEEILPGVRWGRPEWVPSVAYWAFMVGKAEEAVDGYVGREASLQSELGFCLLGGYGITAEMNHAAHARLTLAGMLDPGRRPSAGEIEDLLRQPLEVAGRRARYRFPRQRAGRLAAALARIEDDFPPVHDALAFRRHLMAIPGIGPKTASWVARNWLGSDEVAILDIHVMRAGLLIGLFDRTQRLPRDYEAMERRFIDLCGALGAKPSLLDAVMWRSMRTLGRGAV